MGNNGERPLQFAAFTGCSLTADYLRKYGAHINSASTSTYKNGYAPLHFATEKDHAEVAKILLDRGAIVDVTEEEGSTSLHIACMNHNLNAIKLLVQYGKKVDKLDKNGKATLQFTVEEGMRIFEKGISNIEYILKCCPNINNPQTTKTHLKLQYIW
jgi:ankyrin repeat protein